MFVINDVMIVINDAMIVVNDAMMGSKFNCNLPEPFSRRKMKNPIQ